MPGRDFVWNVVEFLVKIGVSLERIVAVNVNATGVGLLEAAKKGQKGGLAHAVLSKKAVDPAFFKCHRNVFQYRFGTVAESQIVNFNHIFIVY